MGVDVVRSRLVYVAKHRGYGHTVCSGCGRRQFRITPGHRQAADTTGPTSRLPRAKEPVLPKLPVPALEHTMYRYLDTMRPVLTDVQHERLKQIVDKFAGPDGLGPKLQLYLLDRQEKLDNWGLSYRTVSLQGRCAVHPFRARREQTLDHTADTAYDYWLHDMYLACALPLPVGSNPGMVFPPRRFTTVLDVARFAARMLDGALDYKELLDRRGLPLERATSREKGQPLCMSQYYRLLTSCRVPGKPYDTIYTTPAGQNSEHVIVACRNQLYLVPVKAADRGRLNEDELCAQLMHILDDAPCLASPPPVGLLTASQRHHWAEAREALAYDDHNRRNLDLIERSLLVVCLDEPLPTSFNCRLQRGGRGHTAGQRDETNMALQMIHGGGSSVNTANRWFDKTIQIVISNDGTCGLCYEHSPAEGVAVVQLMEQLLKHVDQLPATSTVPTANSHLLPPERLEWTLDATNFKHIQEAAQIVDKLVRDMDFQVYRFTGYGKEFIKSCSVSPDVYIQLMLQLACYRMYGHLVTTYESASTRRFRLGRVDCIRSVSVEALDWATVMCQAEPAGLQSETDASSEDELLNTGKKDQQKYQLFQAAVAKQTDIMIENILGQGIDIHLLGLREAARDTAPTAAHPLPALFTDESYRIANTFLLTTSQVSTTGDCFMGYGAVVPDGYGASYNPKKDSIVFCLSAFHSSSLTSVSRFAQALEESLNSTQALLSRIKVK
ncbi:Choline acetyltransferase [Carabus blaptoides fortunei]